MMYRFLFHFIPTLVLAIGFSSCYYEDAHIQKQVTTRPITPITDSNVRIGSQIWMTKNLNVSRYRNGDIIPQVTNNSQWASLTTGAWCYNRNLTSNGVIYGKLYNWYAVNDPRGLAPVGYHIPTVNDFNVLDLYFYENPQPGYDGGALKETGTTHWQSPNTEATNITGFTALPAGHRIENGSFTGNGFYCYFWTSTEYNSTTASLRLLSYNSANMGGGADHKKLGLVVRCIKD